MDDGGGGGIFADPLESEVMKRISAVGARTEREQEKRALAAARERGVCGPEDTLKALQAGRLHRLLAPWPLEGDVRWCDACALGIPDVSGRELLLLRRADLCVHTRRPHSRLGRRPENQGGILRGENAGILQEEFGGLAGLVRF
jgi:hypothetical protein